MGLPMKSLDNCWDKIIGSRYCYWDSPFGRNLSLCSPAPANIIDYVPNNIIYDDVPTIGQIQGWMFEEIRKIYGELSDP